MNCSLYISVSEAIAAFLLKRCGFHDIYNNWKCKILSKGWSLLVITQPKKTGYTPSTLTGEIVILEKVNGLNVLEIGYRALYQAGVTKIIIKAKLRSINKEGVYDCRSLTYINIPSTVTFIGQNGVNIYQDYTSDLPATVEFNQGRREKIYLDERAISRRKTFYIIYPSTIEPICHSNALQYVETAYICAPKKFTFCGFTTTTDFSHCSTRYFYLSKSRFKCKIEYHTRIIFRSAIVIVIRIDVSIEEDEKQKKRVGIVKRIFRWFKRKLI